MLMPALQEGGNPSMFQEIYTLHLPFVEPQVNRMPPNSPRDAAFLPQNATLILAYVPTFAI